MKLSEQLQIIDECGDVGRAIEGCPEKAQTLENLLEEVVPILKYYKRLHSSSKVRDVITAGIIKRIEAELE